MQSKKFDPAREAPPDSEFPSILGFNGRLLAEILSLFQIAEKVLWGNIWMIVHHIYGYQIHWMVDIEFALKLEMLKVQIPLGLK